MRNKISVFTTAVIAIILVACGNSTPKESPEESLEQLEKQAVTKKGYSIGDIAEDFSLKNIDNEMVSLSSFPEAKGFVVIFTCNHCPFSIAYEDRIIELDKKYKELGYPVIAINPNDPEADGGKGDDFASMQIRAEEKGFTFPYLYDEGQKVYPVYGATKTPHVYVLQNTEEGNIVKYIGAIDDNSKEPENVKEKYLETALNSLLAGEEIEMAETKALGCSIKTK